MSRKRKQIQVLDTYRGGWAESRNPAKFCQFLLRRCEELGLEVIYGTPTSLDRQAGRLHVVSTRGEKGQQAVALDYDKLLVCAGPWSRAVCETLGLPLPAVSNLPGHSVHIRPVPKKLDESLVGKTIFAGVEGESEPGDIVRNVESPSSISEEKDCTSSIELINRYVPPLGLLPSFEHASAKQGRELRADPTGWSMSLGRTLRRAPPPIPSRHFQSIQVS